MLPVEDRVGYVRVTRMQHSVGYVGITNATQVREATRQMLHVGTGVEGGRTWGGRPRDCYRRYGLRYCYSCYSCYSRYNRYSRYSGVIPEVARHVGGGSGEEPGARCCKARI